MRPRPMWRTLVVVAAGVLSTVDATGQYWDPPTLENRNASAAEYYMLEVPDPASMTMDGFDGDWSWFSWEYAIPMHQWRDEGDRPLPGGADLDITARMAWKGSPENRWYVFVTVHDDTLRHGGSTVARWSGDMMGFAVDPQDHGRDRAEGGYSQEYVASPGEVGANFAERYTVIEGQPGPPAWAAAGQPPYLQGAVRVEPAEAWGADPWTSDTGGSTYYEFSLVVWDYLEDGGPAASTPRDLDAQAGVGGFGLPFVFWVEDGDTDFDNDMTVRGAEAAARQYFAHAVLLRAGEYLYPAQITAVYPAEHGYPDSRVTVVFAEPMDSTTVNGNTVLATGSVSGDVPGSVVYDRTSNSATLYPGQEFAVGETVTVTVTGNVRRADGVGIDGNRDGQAEGSPADDFVTSFVVRAPLRMVAYPAAIAPVVDGRVLPGEYAQGVPVYVEFASNAVVPGIVPDWIPVPSSPADLSYTVHALYTSMDLHIAVEVADDVLRGDSGLPWEDDDVEVYVDGDRVGDDMAIRGDLEGAEGFQVIMDAAGNPYSVGRQFGTQWFAAAAAAPGGYVVEFRIPLSSIDAESGAGVRAARSGDTLGFNITVGDDDSGGAPYEHPDDGYGAWSGRAEGWYYAAESDWGRLHLSPTPAPPLALVSPNGSEVWAGSATYPIRWVAHAGITAVRIEYSLNGGEGWQVAAASTPNTGSYPWTVPIADTEAALVRIADAADPGVADLSDHPFAIRQPFVPHVESVWHARTAVFPGEPVTVYAHVLPGDLPVAVVQAEILTQDEESVVGTVPLADDGTSPDEEAGDDYYTGRWTGSASIGYYPIEIAAEDLGGNEGRGEWSQHGDGVKVAHDILSFPGSMLVSPEHLDSVRVPLFMEDDGDGYLTRGFFAAELYVETWETGLGTLSRAFDFTGTALGEGAYASQTHQEPSWWGGMTFWTLNYAMAAPTAVHVTAEPGPRQEVLAYIELSLLPDGPDYVGLSVAPRFDEANEGVEGACCGWLGLGRGDVDTSRTIDAFDASAVLMHVVGRLDLQSGDHPENDWLEEEQGFAFPHYTAHMADASGQVGITAYDAALILQREVGIITHFPAEEGYYRLWEPPSGWWNPPSPPLAKPVVASAPKLDRVVWLGDVEERHGSLLVVPVRIDELEGVLAGAFVVTFDPQQLRPAGVRASALTARYLFADRAEGDAVRVSFAAAVSGSGSGPLAEVQFQRREGAASFGALQLSEVQLNEGDVQVHVGPAGAGAGASLPRVLALYPNYPNPFNPQTTLRYALPEDGPVRLAIYDLTGQRIRVLVDAPQTAGVHEAIWDGRDAAAAAVASGVYLLRLDTPLGSQVRKVTLLK
ncbi:MAG: sugar-binding protein [Candidatus Latescibacterota bacterium]